MRENQMRNYWRVGSVGMALLGFWIVVAAVVLRNPVADLTHGLVALALAMVGAYIGYKKSVHARVLVDTARVYGIVALLAVAGYLSGMVSVFEPVEAAALAASGAVALYVGFTPL